jgi:hypothetical protein
MIKRLVVTLALALPLVALAQLPDPTNTDQYVQAILNALAHGEWKVVAILVAVAIVYALRQVATRLSGPLGIFFKSARGGAVLALLGGIVTSLAGILYAGGAVNVGIILNGVVLGVMAAGGWTLIRRLLWGDAAPTVYPNS